MKRVRILLLFILAATALTASAQEDPTFDVRLRWWSLAENEYQEFEIVPSDFVRVTTVVSWSCNFPAIGFQNAGSVTFQRGDRVQRFNVQFPWDGWYRDEHEGTISISYARNGSVETETSYPFPVYYENPILTVDDLRVVEGDEEQAASLRFSRPSHVAWTLNISAGDGTAHEASDFSLTDREVTFAAGATTSQVRFRAPKDGVSEGQETFTLKGESVRKFDFYTPYLAGTGTITIDDSEITAHAEPSAITVFNGDPFDVSVTLNRPLSSTETVQASIESSDIHVVKPVPAAVPLHPGSTSFSVPFESDQGGDAIITVSFPEAFAVDPVSVSVHVFGGEVTFDRASVTLRKNAQASVGMRMTPAPPQPIVAPIQLSGVGVLRLDDAPPIGTDGASVVTFTGVAVGTAEVQAINRSGNLAILSVNVIETLSAKSITPVSGPTAGGTPVTITGTGFAGACQVAFDSIPATSVTIVNDKILGAIAPAHAAGTANVTVICDGDEEMLPASFTFTSPSRRRSVR